MKINIPEDVKQLWYCIQSNNYTLVGIDCNTNIVSFAGFKYLPSWQLEGEIHLVYRRADTEGTRRVSMRELYRDLLFVRKSRIFYMDKKESFRDYKVGGSI